MRLPFRVLHRMSVGVSCRWPSPVNSRFNWHSVVAAIPVTLARQPGAIRALRRVTPVRQLAVIRVTPALLPNAILVTRVVDAIRAIPVPPPSATPAIRATLVRQLRAIRVIPAARAVALHPANASYRGWLVVVTPATHVQLQSVIPAIRVRRADAIPVIRAQRPIHVIPVEVAIRAIHVGAVVLPTLLLVKLRQFMNVWVKTCRRRMQSLGGVPSTATRAG